jgi:integrase
VKRKHPRWTHGYVDQHGKPRFYLRRPGHKKISLPGLPWSPEFMEAREAALKGEGKIDIGANRTVAGTVNAALVSYYQSTAFTSVEKSTQRMRRAELERFRTDHGDKRIALMHGTAMQAILNGKTPASARNWRKAMRGFLDHCLSLNMIKVDPLAGLTMAKMKKTDGHHPWESSECAQFEAFYPLGTRARLAYALLLQAGQSKCDVVRMGRQHVRNNMMSMRRQKTGVPFNIEIMPMLQEAIDAMPASNHLTFLVTVQGNPFTAAGFGNHFRDLCDAAGLPKRCTSHGLRKAAATYLAEQGASDHQLMAWFGWTSISQAQVYTKAANRKAMARRAAKLISGTGIGSPSDPVSQNDDQDIEIVRSGK